MFVPPPYKRCKISFRCAPLDASPLNLYPASRGPSIFLDKSEGLCSQGIKLGKLPYFKAFFTSVLKKVRLLLFDPLSQKLKKNAEWSIR